jgi:hypothetical protein
MEQKKRQVTVADALEGRCGAHVQHTNGRHHRCYWLSIQLIKELPGPCSYPSMLTLLFIRHHIVAKNNNSCVSTSPIHLYRSWLDLLTYGNQSFAQIVMGKL